MFFVRNLRFIAPTEVRRISLGETLLFETIHEGTYREFGFEPISVEPGSVTERRATGSKRQLANTAGSLQRRF